MQIPIFVINLDRSPERLQTILGNLASLGLKFERVPAVDGRALNDVELRAAYQRRFWRPAPTPGEIGCHLSHIRALQCVVDRGLTRAIIAEDDAQFGQAFLQIAKQDFDPGVNFDVLKLEGIGLRKMAIKIPGSHPNIAVMRNSYGSACYLVTLDGAKRILKRLTPMTSFYDDELFCYWRNGLHVYDYLPYPVRQAGAPTTIHFWHKEKASPLKRWWLSKFDHTRQHLFDVARFGVPGMWRYPVEAFKS